MFCLSPKHYDAFGPTSCQKQVASGHLCLHDDDRGTLTQKLTSVHRELWVWGTFPNISVSSVFWMQLYTPKNKASMQCRKRPFTLSQLKIARLRTLWVQAAALTYLEVRPPQQGQVFPDRAHMQTGQGCRRQATFIISNCCNECQDQRTKLKCCRCLDKHGLKGNAVWGAFRRQRGRWRWSQSCSTYAKQFLL